MFDLDDLPSFMPGSEQAVQIAEVRAVVRVPAAGGAAKEGAERPGVAVIAPGNPARHLGSGHAGQPLHLALERECLEAGLRTVRFDYRGVGMSAADGRGDDAKDWQIGSFDDMRSDAGAVVAWAKENLGGTVVFVGYSMSANLELDGVFAGLLPVYVGLSMATEIYRYVSSDPWAQEAAKADTAWHRDMDVPSLYVVGSKDRMTPLQELEKIVKSRRDGGAGVTIRVVEGANHPFEGYEAEAAEICARWVKDAVMSLPCEPEPS